MKIAIDVTRNYINKATSHSGNIGYEEGYSFANHKKEVAMANWLHDVFGGDILLLAETGGIYGTKRPDFDWCGKFWELKTLKSEKSIDSAVRKAIGQIYDNPGGIILDFGKNTVSVNRIESAIKSRIDASCRFKVDVMIICAKKLQKVIRYE